MQQIFFPILTAQQHVDQSKPRNEARKWLVRSQRLTKKQKKTGVNKQQTLLVILDASGCTPQRGNKRPWDQGSQARTCPRHTHTPANSPLPAPGTTTARSPFFLVRSNNPILVFLRCVILGFEDLLFLSPVQYSTVF